jgi:hypothetical protein
MSVSSSDAVWFTVAMRSIGILVLALGIPWLASETMAATWYLLPQAGGPVWVSNRWQPFMLLLGPLLQVVLGLYLAFGGGALRRICLGSVGARRPVCNYDVRGIRGATCPECGIGLPGRDVAHTRADSE